MLTEFLRDQATAIVWLALMAGGWFGWSQEDPPKRLSGWWGAGSVIGLLVSVAFGLLVWRNWSTPSALEGNYWGFGIIVLAEAVLIGGGCIVLARRGATRWYGWWIGLCVALHFVPLAWLFADPSYGILVLVQVIGLLAMRPALARSLDCHHQPMGLPLDRRHIPDLRARLGGAVRHALRVSLVRITRRVAGRTRAG